MKTTRLPSNPALELILICLLISLEKDLQPKHFLSSNWLSQPMSSIFLKQQPLKQLFLQDIHKYEDVYGPIAKNSLVIAYTGWSKHWPNSKTYRNETKFPVFGLPAIELLKARKIAGVAIDTLALEKLGGTYPGHKLLMGAGVYIIENIANCSQLPPKGATVIALPLKVESLREVPARVIALIP